MNVSGPLTALGDEIAGGTLRADAPQQLVAARLQRLHDEIAAYAPAAHATGWRLFRSAKVSSAPRGIYIYGPVGRGKSMLMNLFFDGAPTTRKRRIHFHALMLEIQQRLHLTHTRDPLVAIAATLAHDYRLLCIDEFHVIDMADAMILGTLFKSLIERGVVVVATSNRAPERLYEGGYQRERFLPFIEFLRRRLDILPLAGDIDYRLGAVNGQRVYFTPCGSAAEAALTGLFKRLAGGSEAAPMEVAVGTRRIRITQAAARVAAFAFKDLCEQPVGAADYLALADHFDALIVHDVPLLTMGRRAGAKRFMTLVDVLYERRTLLALSAAAPAEALLVDEVGGFAFQRTVSRLAEMSGGAYLARFPALTAARAHTSGTLPRIPDT